MFFFIFVLFPLLEILLLMTTTAEIGFLRCLALLIAGGIAGSFIIRYQGFKTVLAMRQAADSGVMPANAVFDGFCLYAAGALLILPGFFSDALAMLLLLPQGRRMVQKMVRRYAGWDEEAGPYSGTASFSTAQGVIEGEYERIDDGLAE